MMRGSHDITGLKGLLTLTITATVLSFTSWAWLGFALPKAWVLSVGLVVFFVVALFRGGRLPVNVATVLCGGVFLLMGVTTVFSPAPWTSAVGSSGLMQGGLIQMLFLGVFVAALLVGEGLWRSRVWVYLMATVALYAMLQWLGLDPLQSVWNEEAFLFRSFSTLGNPNWLASFLVLGTPLVWMNLKGKARVALMSLVLAALLTTGSKAGFVGMGLLLLGLTRSWKWGLGILGAGALSVLLFFPSELALWRSTGARQEIWLSTFDLIRDWPWGHGVDLFGFVFAPFASPTLWEFESLTAWISSPHNIILEWLVEFGVFGTALMLVCAGVLLWPERRTPLALGVAAYGVTLLFGFETIATAALMWAMVGTLAARHKKWFSIPSRPVAAVVFCFLLVNVGWLSWRAVGNFHYEAATEALRENDLELAAHHFQIAIQIYPYHRVVLLEASEFFLSLETSAVHPLVDAYLTQCERLGAGLDPECPALAAWLAAEQGDAALVQTHLESAFVRNPASIRTYYFALQTYHSLGDEAAYALLKDELLNLLPDFYDEPDTEAGRLFQKNHPWVFEL